MPRRPPSAHARARAAWQRGVTHGCGPRGSSPCESATRDGYHGTTRTYSTVPVCHDQGTYGVSDRTVPVRPVILSVPVRVLYKFVWTNRSFVSGPSRPDTHPQAPKRRAWEALTNRRQCLLQKAQSLTQGIMSALFYFGKDSDNSYFAVPPLPPGQAHICRHKSLANGAPASRGA